MKAVRLQKFIADCGVTSRRKAEELISQGRVQVNGEIVIVLGTKVDPEVDIVAVDNEVLDRQRVEKLYVVLHKPRGCVTTLNDPEGRSTVMDLVKEVTERIYPVGRLDYLSEGLLVLTNDGELANTIMHPSSEIVKVYEVKVFGAVSERILKNLRSGVQLEDGFAKAKSVRVIKQLEGKTWLEFRLNEGRNREIRRICEACGLTVDKLKRVAIGALTIEGIAPGKYRMISKRDLQNCMGIDQHGKVSVDHPLEYWSTKKTIDLKKKGHQDCTLADDLSYQKLRRETYFETLRNLKESKEKRKLEERAAAFLEKESAHKKRQEKKLRKKEAKEETKSFPHAQFV